ncbi:pathogenesis-related transcriptional factor and ERF protein [Burkholderia aenigmatica]|uniref:Pathogenesis-related transcriptional factor and ERF protein n=1 Tax=Burkholderia aenigmatica TaxID=2015348 RepID=A0ABY6Y204_9BURK|nr:AP2 domain-containing protein [Burkholderia aenigmatica]VWD01890.1 pathogenesis-related transcriptional factor and ERF protein [Burkholderia aenigmatica]
MCKSIELTRGYSAIVDDEDFDDLSRFSWYAMGAGEAIYAARYASIEQGGPVIYMHRQIIGGNPVCVDHANRDTLDNRRANLRAADVSRNAANVGLSVSNRSGFKGVVWDATREKWRADIRVNGRRFFLGYYSTSEEAARAYDFRALKEFGEFAFQNFH